jgi:NAD(P)-dependent dehydrogenase (short-subunit alcohol dehydrogenase family)
MTGTSASLLDGKVAIVTGAGRGIGRVMALGLLDAGACVAAAELDGEVLEELQDAAEEYGAGDRIINIAADVTQDDSGAKIVRATTDRFGHVDILVNNAGINISLFRRPDAKDFGKFWDVTPEEFRRIIDVNVVAPFLMTRAALPGMLKQHWGRIINVTTSLDMMWSAFMQPYGGSKAANEAHLAAMSIDLEGTGVTANVLVPGGAADTRMVPPGMAPDRAKLVSPSVMVAPLLWLCSNASDGVTGQRFIGARWDKNLPPAAAAKLAGAPAAWQQLGRQAIMPNEVR